MNKLHTTAVLLLFLFLSTSAQAKGWKKSWKTVHGTITLVSNMGMCAKKVITPTERQKQQIHKGITSSSRHHRIAVLISRCDMIQLPNGSWIYGFPTKGSLDKVVTIDKRLFLFFGPRVKASNEIYEWKKTKLQKISNPMPKQACIGKKSYKHYHEVHHDCGDSDFAGFVAWSGKEWRYIKYPHKTARTEWIKTIAEQSNKILIQLTAGRKIEYNITKNQWKTENIKLNQKCSSRAKCKSNLICDQGFCKKKIAIRGESCKIRKCGKKLTCKNSKCVRKKFSQADGQQCIENAQECKKDLSCQNGYCTPENKACKQIRNAYKKAKGSSKNALCTSLKALKCSTSCK